MAAPATRLRVRVSPGARRAQVAGRLSGAWKLRVAAPAEDGRANEAVCRLLAETLSVRHRDGDARPRDRLLARGELGARPAGDRGRARPDRGRHVRDLRDVRPADLRGAPRGDPVRDAVHRLPPQGRSLSEPAPRQVDVRVGSATDGLTPISVAE